MSKKQLGEGHQSPYMAGTDVVSPQKGLEIRRKRELGEVLKRLADGDPLPDWSQMKLADRFSVVLRTMTVTAREALNKSDTQLRRYETGAEIPFTVFAKMAVETGLPIEWLAMGAPTTPAVMLPASALEDISVRKLSFSASAGAGSLAVDDQAGSHPFPRSALDAERGAG